MILLVVIGDLVQQGVTQSDMSLRAVAAVGAFGSARRHHLVAELRSKAARRVLESAPIVILQHGKAIERNLTAERLSLDEVASAARGHQSIASLEDVEWAIVEPSGQISFIPNRPSD